MIATRDAAEYKVYGWNPQVCCTRTSVWKDEFELVSEGNGKGNSDRIGRMLESDNVNSEISRAKIQARSRLTAWRGR